MGAALLGRGEDAILFASVGGGLKDADGNHLLPNGMKLYPFAGGLCLIMSLLTPWVMKYSVRVADRMGRGVPEWLRFGGVLIQRTMAVELAPDSHKRHGHAVAVTISLLLFFACVMGLVATFKPEDEVMHWRFAGAGLAMWALLALSIRFRFRKFQEAVKLTGLDMYLQDRKMLVDYVSTTLAVLLLMGLGMVALAPLEVVYALLLVPLGLGYVLVQTHSINRRAVSPPEHLRAEEMLEMSARTSGKRLRKRRRDRKW